MWVAMIYHSMTLCQHLMTSVLPCILAVSKCTCFSMGKVFGLLRSQSHFCVTYIRAWRVIVPNNKNNTMMASSTDTTFCTRHHVDPPNLVPYKGVRIFATCGLDERSTANMGFSLLHGILHGLSRGLGGGLTWLSIHVLWLCLSCCIGLRLSLRLGLWLRLLLHRSVTASHTAWPFNRLSHICWNISY